MFHAKSDQDAKIRRKVNRIKLRLFFNELKKNLTLRHSKENSLQNINQKLKIDNLKLGFSILN